MNKKLIINIYNQEIKKESIQYEDKIKYKALLVKEGKAKAYNEDEFLELLKKKDYRLKNRSYTNFV
nr:hypothetical protein [uncultured Faecalibacillus sp.]